MAAKTSESITASITASITEPRTETRTCPICGAEYEVELGKRGRPREYCTRACGLLATHLTMLRASIDEVMPHINIERATQLRRELWSMANTVNSVTRGKKNGVENA